MCARLLTPARPGGRRGWRGARTVLAALIVAMPLAAAGTPRRAAAAEWGTIVPGQSTMDAVRQQFGAPTRVNQARVDDYDTEEWLYEGEQAPTGMVRMVIEFGLVVGTSGFRRELVRAFLLQPKPRIFNRRTIVNGWGLPDRTGHDGQGEVFFYQDGLVVYFDKDGEQPRSMVFTPPQPTAPAPRPPAPSSPR